MAGGRTGTRCHAMLSWSCCHSPTGLQKVAGGCGATPHSGSRRGWGAGPQGGTSDVGVVVGRNWVWLVFKVPPHCYAPVHKTAAFSFPRCCGL